MRVRALVIGGISGLAAGVALLGGLVAVVNATGYSVISSI